MTNAPDITAKRFWSPESVRAACICNNLYTKGDNEEYSEMLRMVEVEPPTYDRIYIIATDICLHSEMQTVTNVMYILENEAVTTTFELDGNDNI